MHVSKKGRCCWQSIGQIELSAPIFESLLPSRNAKPKNASPKSIGLSSVGLAGCCYIRRPLYSNQANIDTLKA